MLKMTYNKSVYTTFIIILVLSGCMRMSIYEIDSSAGFNGSFEKTKAGLPLNWWIHAPVMPNSNKI